MRRANCEREIINVASPWAYNDQNWIHKHSEHKECDRPNVAVPKIERGDTE